MSMQHPALYIAPSSISGRGVFSTIEIHEGEFIEACPVIILPKQDLQLIHQTFLHDYYFMWKKKKCAIALGYGSLYNHATHPNADYKMDYSNKTIDIFCIKNIKAGEEITISYIHDEKQAKNLWFADES